MVFGAYIAFSYVLSFRGVEGFMLDLSAMRKNLDDLAEHIVIALKGKVKGESHERDHMFPCVTVTSSGINVKSWLLMLLRVHKAADRNGGPAITS